MTFLGGRRDTIQMPGWLHGLAGLDLPGNLMTGLEAFHIMTGTPVQAARNWAPGKANGAVVGAPVGNGKYLACRSGLNYIRTGILDTDALAKVTIAAFGRHDPAAPAITASASRFMFGGSYDATAGVGFSIYSGADTDFRCASRYITGGVQDTKVAALTDNPRLWGLRIGTAGDAADDVYARNETLASSQAADVEAGKVRVPNGRPVCFGSDPSRVYGANGHLVFGAVWSRIFTLDDRLELAAYSAAQIAPLALTD